MKIRIGMQCSKTPAIMIGAQGVLIGIRLFQWLSSGAMSVSLKLMVVITQMVILLLILFVLLSMSLVRIFDMAKTDRSGWTQRLKLFGKEAPPLILLYILLQPVFLLLDLAKLQK